MARLSLSFFGSFLVSLDGRPVHGFESGKVRALLAYLAVESDRPHSRDALAGLLWPNQPELAAHASLSQALANLRRAIGDSAARPPFLKITRDSIQFNTESDHTLDVAEFLGRLTAWKLHVHRRAETCKLCADRLQAAADLYRGNFLEEFFLRGNERFEDWLLLKRERLRRLALEALYHLSDYYERCGNHEQAYQYAARQIEIDAWREQAYRQAMQALALSGQRNAALALYESVRQILSRELGVEPTTETAALYEQIKAGVLPVGPPSLGLPHDGLPTFGTSFIGREAELRLVIDCLENPKCRLVTLTGPGGIGKTRLALEAAVQCAESYSAGVSFVSANLLISNTVLVTAIANALRIAFSDPADHAAQLLTYLRDKDMLLIIDGLEGLLSAAGLLATISQQAPRVVVLVTSRQRLGLQEEWVLDVQGLPCPRDTSLDALETYGAVSLFVQCARMVRARFSLSVHNAPYVTRICQLVEGTPLAIELAAARLSAFSCKDIAYEIERDLDFLAIEQHDATLPHRSMTAVFDRSWDMLSSRERSALQQLSVFRSGFSKEEAGQTAGVSVPVLTSLVDKSLVRKSAAGRYEMHELIRRYSVERLQKVVNEERRLVSATADLSGAFLTESAGRS